MRWVVALSLLAPMVAASAPEPSPTSRASFFYTGQMLKGSCEKDDDLSLGICLGYIDSVVDALLFKDTFSDVHRTCMSERITNKEIRPLVLSELLKQGAAPQMPAFIYVQQAIAKAYGCARLSSGR